MMIMAPPKKQDKAPAAPAVPAKGAPAARGAKGAAPVEAPVEAPKEEKKKEKKSQKERPKSKTKHKNVQIWKLYEVRGNELVRKGRFCPRCGSGTFLAEYKNRKYCGKCGFSEIAVEAK